jgi:dihydroxyacetone kinase
MTSYDMVGFSVSMLPLDTVTREALLAPVRVPAWPTAVAPHRDLPLPLPDLAPRTFTPSRDESVESALRTICRVLRDSEADLNALDARIGDGDTGSTLAHAARAVEAALPTLPLAQPAQLRQALAQLLSRAMGGSSGVLLSILLSAADGDSWNEALKRGLERLQECGGAPLGGRTAVDALHPALHAQPGQRAVAARSGAQATAGMRKAQSGRAAYVPEEYLQDVVDPGAEAVARVFEALSR